MRLDRLIRKLAMMAGVVALSIAAPPTQAQDVIFKKSTVWKMLTPDDKLVVYGIDDPAIDGVACHYTTPERGGV
jgi:CreA protein